MAASAPDRAPRQASTASAPPARAMASGARKAVPSAAASPPWRPRRGSGSRSRAPAGAAPTSRSGGSSARWRASPPSWRRAPSTGSATAAAASPAPAAGDPAAAGSRSAAAGPDSDPAADQAASRAVAGRGSCVSPSFPAETNDAAPRLPSPHYQVLTRHQISAAMPPPSGRARPPSSVHGNNQED